jgi:hypothetical protein
MTGWVANNRFHATLVGNGGSEGESVQLIPFIDAAK